MQVNSTTICARSVLKHAINSVILTQIEEGSLSWREPAKINEVRQKFILSSISAAAFKSSNVNFHSGTYSSNSSSNSISNMQSNFVTFSKYARPCSNFNLGKCDLQKQHPDSAGNTSAHICSFCYTQGKQYPHTEASCRKKSVIPPFNR